MQIKVKSRVSGHELCVHTFEPAYSVYDYEMCVHTFEGDEMCIHTLEGAYTHAFKQWYLYILNV